jgi:hypothetical protein
MNLNFIFPYKNIPEVEPEYPFMNGPGTCELTNTFSITFDFEIKENHINYLVIETFQKFKLAQKLLRNREGFNGVDIVKFVIDNDIRLLICSVADPAVPIEKQSLIRTVNDYNLSDRTYFLETNFNHKDDKNTLCWHFFLEDAKNNLTTIYNNEQNQLGYTATPIQEDELDGFRTKKFLSFNRQVDRRHRASLLYDYINNDFSDSYFSFLVYNTKYEKLFQEGSEKDDLKKYQNYVPIELDTQLIENKHNFITGDALRKDLFLNSCIHLVTETSFVDNELFISEKILKPILGYQPFILLGPYRYLNEIKKYGFKTFSEFWDESYDEIEDPTDRYRAVMKIVLELNSKSIEELNDLYQKTKNICIYNRKAFDTIQYNFINIINTLKN